MLECISKDSPELARSLEDRSSSPKDGEDTVHKNTRFKTFCWHAVHLKFIGKFIHAYVSV